MLKFLTNRHVVIALLVAPVLAVFAWMGVGQLAGEQPHQAQPGQQYPLVEQSNCRYVSEACDLRNEDFRLRLTYVAEEVPMMQLNASHPLDGVLMSVSELDTAEPSQMHAVEADGLHWELALVTKPTRQEKVRLAARAGGSVYFAEASTAFLQEE